jgi:hypothetical protein
MSIHYFRDQAHNRLITTADGLQTFEDINAHLDLEERNGDLNRPELIDARNATTNITAQQVRLLAHRAEGMLSRVRLGPTALVTNDDLVFGMARMYSVFAESAGAVVEVFRDIEVANRWLSQFGHAKI